MLARYRYVGMYVRDLPCALLKTQLTDASASKVLKVSTRETAISALQIQTQRQLQTRPPGEARLGIRHDDHLLARLGSQHNVSLRATVSKQENRSRQTTCDSKKEKDNEDATPLLARILPTWPVCSLHRA